MAVRRLGYHYTPTRQFTDGGENVSQTRRPLVTPQEYFWYSFLLESVDFKATVYVMEIEIWKTY
jgi:hypothetical protein